jgi:arginyl-tRNA synthetase
MLSSDVRHAIERAVAAAGLGPAEPGLRPTGTPGQYASSVAFALGEPVTATAARIAAALAGSGPVARAEVTGPGFITVTVSPQALADLPGRINAAGPGCARSDALRGRTVAAPPPADPLAAPGWEQARIALAAQLTARLAAAAGATVAPDEDPERTGLAPDADQSAVRRDDRVRSSAAEVRPAATGARPETDVAAAVAFAGADAVLFSLARAVPGRPVSIDRRIIARHLTDNPAYAVRYAHARAVSAARWAGYRGETVRQHPPASRRELVLIDALCWLPERVAAAARRGRPDEFARYLEELAAAAIGALAGAGSPGSANGPEADRLALAGAARTGLAAGLGLLGISAPDRL